MALRKVNNRYYGEYSDLTQQVGQYRHETKFLCPYCEELKGSRDTIGHFYYNVMFQVGHCFRCEAIIKDDGLRSLDLIRQQLDEVPDHERYKNQIFNLNGWTFDITRHETEQLDYMVNTRGIFPEVLERFNVKICMRPRQGVLFCNKLWSANGNLVTDFFQIRNLEGLPKYLNIRDEVKPLSWLDMVEHEKVMLVEGFISGLSAYQHMDGDIDPVVLQGKTISHFQVGQLKRACAAKRIRQIYIVLDGGYFENGLRMAKILDRELPETTVSVTKLPHKRDPNELKKRQFKDCILGESHVYSSLREGQVRDAAYGKRKQRAG